MSTPERGEPKNSVDPSLLKALPDCQVVEALLDDARFATTYLEGMERERVEAQLMDMCWVLNEEEQAIYEEQSESLDRLLGQFSSAIVSEVTGEDLSPEAASQALARTQAGHALARIARHKRELEEGLKSQKEDDFSDWTEGSTMHHLGEICGLQAATGINLAGDYVRETALSAITDAGYRGLALLRNAQIGGAASYQLGIDALQQGIDEKSLGHDSARVGTDLVIEFLKQAKPEERPVLRNLAINLLARMREWVGIRSIPPYTYSYVFAAAKLAVTLRDQENRETTTQPNNPT